MIVFKSIWFLILLSVSFAETYAKTHEKFSTQESSDICTIDLNGRFSCSGFKEEMQIIYENLQKRIRSNHVLSFAISDLQLCVITEKHKLYCEIGHGHEAYSQAFRRNQSHISILEEKLKHQKVTSVVAGHYNLCAIDEDRHLSCEGRNTANILNIYKTLEDREVLSVSLGEFQACAISLPDYALHCSGQYYRGSPNQIALLLKDQEISQVVVSETIAMSTICAITRRDQKLHCLDSAPEEKPYSFLELFSIIDGQRYNFCGMTVSDGKVICWSGAYSSIFDTHLLNEHPARSVKVSNNRACAIDFNGESRCIRL
jgi:hypothetical protein